MNSGSGIGFSVLARSNAIKMVILRPSGFSQFSGTSSVPHCASNGSFGILQSVSLIVRRGALLSAQPVSNVMARVIRKNTNFRMIMPEMLSSGYKFSYSNLPFVPM